MLRSLLAWASLTALASVHCFAETPAPAAAAASIPTAPQLDARAYILVDYRTDKILAAKDAVAREEPASLTKLMTAYIVFQELAAGKLKLNEQVTVSEHAWRSEGSRTFIELGKPVSVEDLILGMIVQSGNDATIALAERIAGTEADDERQCQTLGDGRQSFRKQLRTTLAPALHHRARFVVAGQCDDSRVPAVLQVVFSA
jgi:D-alanyl-D-alanine carboxypeptidase